MHELGYQNLRVLVFIFGFLFILSQPLGAAPTDLDESFGDNGRVFLSLGGDGDILKAINLTPEGKILLGGEAKSPNRNFDYGLAQLNTDGSLDTSFNNGTGFIIFDSVNGFDFIDELNAMFRQPDGRVVMTGFTVRGNAPGRRIQFLARINPDGLLDNTFGTTGRFISDFLNPPRQSIIFGADLQQDNKIVTVGLVENDAASTGLDFAVVRHLSDGSFDNGFGAQGKATVVFENANVTDIASNVLFIPENNLEKLLVVGTSNNDFALALINPDGLSFDTNFGSLNGRERTDLANGSTDGVSDATLLSNGKILVLGTSNEDVALVQYESNGQLDLSFGNGGIVITDLNNQSFDLGKKVKLQNDGKILVAASTGEEVNQDAVIIRYNSDGSLDDSFGTGGIQIIDVDNGSIDAANDLAIQSDQKILLGISSSANPDAPAQFVVLRLLGESNGGNDGGNGGGGGNVNEGSGGGCSLSNNMVSTSSFLWLLLFLLSTLLKNRIKNYRY